MNALARIKQAFGIREALIVLSVAVATAYGGLLRLDSLVGKYGSVDRPAWARVLTHDVASFAASVRPSRIVWGRVPRPYDGGDPVNYLKYAREFTSFYQPHVREPVFLATTRGALSLLEDQDIALSFASAAGSTLAIPATYLVGAALFSPLAGVFAAVLVALDMDMVMWSADGWRDDTFTAMVLFAVWALLRMRARPTVANGVLAGVVCGLACLTRITALSFVLPGLAWLVVDRGKEPRRARGRAATVAAAALLLTLGPYLVSCWRATGDPFISINYHTLYYSAAERKPLEKPISVAEYLGGKVKDQPVRALDTALNGMFVQPFVTKWHGLGLWLGPLVSAVKIVALAGLAALILFPAGRLALVALAGALVPYMLTWNVGAGSEWRFTMHVYPLYLAAAGVVVAGAARLASGRRMPPRPELVRTAWALAAVIAVAVAGVAAYVMLPWYVVREAIARGESTSIETGERDGRFYRAGWSSPFRDNITTRVSLGDRSIVRLPLPDKRACDIVLRIDPVTPGAPERVDVLFNRKWVANLRLSYDPERVGSYRFHVGADLARAGSNEIVIMPATTVSREAAGPRFSWLDPGARPAIRLWYVRVVQ